MAADFSAQNDPPCEERIQRLGREIFRLIGKSQPSAFKQNYWAARIMEWSMTKPSFKVNMFRLVDVLPALSSTQSIVRHMNEYLGPVARDIHPLVNWAVNARPGSARGAFTAWVMKRSIENVAKQFIAGSDAADARGTLRTLRRSGIASTVDLLGEYSLSESEAEKAVARYVEALQMLSADRANEENQRAIIPGHRGERTPICASVKLTALYSQCSALNMRRSVDILSQRLATIVRAAVKADASVYIDAEDMGNNPVIYAVFRSVFGDSEFRSFPFPGAVVQAYAKDAGSRVSELLQFARQRGSPIAIRLVKGAYWDHETISAQQNGWPSPLFRNKQSSDANYEALTRTLLDNREHVLPAFGSHNVRSLCHACAYAAERDVPPTEFEMQMLYGMAEPIAKAFVSQGYLVRYYVPVGDMLPGMGYLVRRLLENTSNESFLRHTFFDAKSVDRLLRAPQMID